jgi:hypothetical protein
MVMALAAPLAISGAKKLLSKKKKASSPQSNTSRGRSSGTTRRRRRARLTQGDIMELTNIKNILGRTAAANALPYYLGRGRG